MSAQLDLTLPDPARAIDGATYDPDTDFERLSRQLRRVWRVLKANEGKWLHTSHIAQEAGCPETSAGSRCRDFRKDKYGRKNVLCKKCKGHQGLWLYGLFPGVYGADQQLQEAA